MLDTTKTPSQNDLWCVVGTDTGSASVAVEGKAGEDFDRRLVDWLKSEGNAKDRRLAFLCDTLGSSEKPGEHLRYQLFHRAASAVLEARRWRLTKALMLVQAFGESQTSWQDYSDFASWLGLKVTRDDVAGPVDASGVDLYLTWIDCPLAADDVAAAAV